MKNLLKIALNQAKIHLLDFYGQTHQCALKKMIDCNSTCQDASIEVLYAKIGVFLLILT